MSNPNTNKDADRARTAVEQFHAVAMIPPEEHEPPLTVEELKPRLGSAVLADGVNYSELSEIYKVGVHGQKGTRKVEAWLQKPLREFEKVETMGTMLLNHRLLVYHDAQAHRKAGIKRFEKWLLDSHEFRISRTTVYRRIGHARLALLLAAVGKINLLPSQNVAGRIAHWLPRTHWADYLAAHPEKSLSEAAVDKKILLFSKKHGIPLRREPAIPKETLEDSCSNLPLKSEGTNGASKNNSDEESPKPIAVKLLVPLFKEELPSFLPKNQADNLSKFCKSFPATARKLVHAVPKPARNAQRAKLHASLRSMDPARANEIENAALMNFYALVEKQIFVRSAKSCRRRARR